MKIEYTGRNFTVSTAIKKHVNEHFKKVGEFLNGDSKAHVILAVEKHHRNVAEIVVNWQHHTLTATADTVDMYNSTTQAIEKLRRQVVKLHDKIVNRKHQTRGLKSLKAATDVTPAPDAPRIIRSRRYAVKPLTPDEALSEVAASSDQFLVFRDAETDRIGVLYKRKDGNFGLIEP
ncbi:MAG: ribosome-associated translation inhibitor RaiA [Acidobacteria bacterium]|nr:ribosome-associated translation inhibitor RaiA [Acidobacteriota bacterium]